MKKENEDIKNRIIKIEKEKNELQLKLDKAIKETTKLAQKMPQSEKEIRTLSSYRFEFKDQMKKINLLDNLSIEAQE